MMTDVTMEEYGPIIYLSLVISYSLIIDPQHEILSVYGKYK
jgi:hypothetical protein